MKQFIDNISLFSLLSNREKDALVHAMSVLSFRPGEVIVREGDPGDLLYIIKDGMVICT